jgi:PhnB protein
VHAAFADGGTWVKRSQIPVTEVVTNRGNCHVATESLGCLLGHLLGVRRAGSSSLGDVPAPEPYLHFPGTAREALTFYQEVFGGDLILNTFGEFGRDDGPPHAIAHGILRGAVSLFAADTAGLEEPFRSAGLMFSLLGTTSAAELRSWFDALAEEGTVREELQARPWGASDGQVVDRFGVHWLVGFEDTES